MEAFDPGAAPKQVLRLRQMLGLRKGATEFELNVAIKPIAASVGELALWLKGEREVGVPDEVVTRDPVFDRPGAAEDQ